MKILFILLYVSYTLNATQLNPFYSLKLSSALKIVKLNNLQIKIANFNEKIAQINIKQIKGQSFGTLNFVQKFARSNNALSVFGFKLTSRKATFNDFGFSQFGKITNSTPPDALNYPDDYNFFQSSIRYQVPIFTGFKLTSYKHIAQALKKMQTLNKLQLIDAKIFQVKKTYYSLSLISNTIKQLTIILKNMDTLKATAKQMKREGYATNIDILEVQAKRANVKRLLNQMRANKQLLYQYLSFLLNKKVISIVLPPQDVKMQNITNKQILANNLDIKKAKTGLFINHNLVKVSEASYYPSIGAFAQISTADNTFLGDANKHKAYTIGAKLTWNIFSGGVDSAIIQKAKIQQLKTDTRLDFTKQAIFLKIQKIKTQIKSFTYEINSLKQSVKLADAIYKNYQNRYHEQLISINDVIIKQSKEIQAILKLQTMRNKRNNSIFELQQISNGEQ